MIRAWSGVNYLREESSLEQHHLATPLTGREPCQPDIFFGSRRHSSAPRPSWRLPPATMHWGLNLNAIGVSHPISPIPAVGPARLAMGPKRVREIREAVCVIPVAARKIPAEKRNGGPLSRPAVNRPNRPNRPISTSRPSRHPARPEQQACLPSSPRRRTRS